MRSHYRLWGLVGLAALAALVLAAPVLGVERGKGFAKFDPGHETVELFAGIKAGQLDAQLFAKDPTQCRLLIGNKTQRPLNVRIPDVLAGVPVLAQFFPGPGNMQGNQQGNIFADPNNNANAAPQALGIPTQPGMMNQGGGQGGPMFNIQGGGPAGFNNRQGGGLFSIAPESVGQLKLPAVCLEHGKPNPRAAVPYQVRPIESVASKTEVQEICRMLGQGELNQKTAQAAVWRLNNGMTWEALTAERIQFAMGRLSEPLFTSKQIRGAKNAVERAVQLAKDRKPAGDASMTASR